MTGVQPGDATMSLGDSASAGAGLDVARVGRYILIEVLGKGGMGVVFSAYDPELDRRIAVKLLHAQADGSDPTPGQARLMREAQAMARLAHANVIPVYDVGTVGDRVFFTMEQVKGQTLRSWYRSRPHTWREVLAVFQQAGSGLAAAHAAGIVHRDFKPENVLVGDDGRVRVTDFGVARAMEAPTGTDDPAQTGASPGGGLAVTVTRVGQMVGTPGYLAPEQLDGVVTARSDQFSFCLALYEALTGELPFARSPLDVYAGQLRAKRVAFPPSSRVPRLVREVVLRGLEKDPAQRHPSMEALLRALGRDPTARRIRGAALASLVLLAAGAGGWAIVDHTRAERACVQLAGRARASWERNRTAVAAAFRKTGQSFAADALRTVERDLSAFAQAWGQARGAVCRGTVALPGEARAASAACLDQAAQSLDHAGQVMAGGDGVVVQHAAQMVAALPPVNDCTDLLALQSAPAPPARPEVAARAAAIEAQLARAQIVGIPRPQETIAAVRAMLGEIQRLGHVPTLARAYFVLAEAEVQANLSSGEQSLQQAAELALQGRDDRLFIRAASRLAHTIGRFPEQRGRAHDWMNLARQAYERAGRPAALTAWLELMQLGVLVGAGRWEACAPVGERALAEARRLGNPFLEVEAAYTLAYCRQHSGTPEEVLRMYEAAMNGYTALVGPDHPETSNAEGSVAWARWVAGDPKGALPLSEKRLATNRAQGEPTVQMASALESHAEILSDLGREEEALAARREALGILQRGPHRTISRIKITAGLASSERILGARAEAFAHASEAVVGCTPEVARDFAQVCASAFFIHAQVLADRGQRAQAASQAARARDGFARLPVTRRLHALVEAWARQAGLTLPPAASSP